MDFQYSIKKKKIMAIISQRPFFCGFYLFADDRGVATLVKENILSIIHISRRVILKKNFNLWSRQYETCANLFSALRCQQKFEEHVRYCNTHPYGIWFIVIGTHQSTNSGNPHIIDTHWNALGVI